MARVLIVEDDADIREALEEALAIDGHSVLSAPDGQAGMRMLRESEPDLVLLDLMMPVMDGWQFLAERDRDARARDVPVVVMSAAGARGSVRSASAYLAKPFELGDLLATVTRAQRSAVAAPGRGGHGSVPAPRAW